MNAMSPKGSLVVVSSGRMMALHFDHFNGPFNMAPLLSRQGSHVSSLLYRELALRYEILLSPLSYVSDKNWPNNA